MKISLQYHHRCWPEACSKRGLIVVYEILVDDEATSYPYPDLRCIESGDELYFNGRIGV